MRQIIHIAPVWCCLALRVVWAQTPVPLTVPVQLCISGKVAEETVTMAWNEAGQAYYGKSQRDLPPGMYQIDVSGPRDPGLTFRVMIGDAAPELWFKHTDYWRADMVRVGVGGPLRLWQDAQHPLQALTMRCEPNLAAAKYYRMEPAPNFRPALPDGCCDIDDRVQLTDGRLATAWPDQVGTVAWANVGEVAVSIDLGRTQDITRVYVNMGGGGLGGVLFPGSVIVSGALGPLRQLPGPQAGARPGPATNMTFMLLGRWLNPKLPEPGNQQVERVMILAQGQARYLQVRFTTGRSNRLFIDEIEVY